MGYLILGYDFDCREFQYQGRTVQGLVFEVKTNEKISRRNRENITVELSQKNGFWVRLHQNAIKWNLTRVMLQCLVKMLRGN